MKKLEITGGGAEEKIDVRKDDLVLMAAIVDTLCNMGLERTKAIYRAAKHQIRAKGILGDAQ